MTTEIETSDNVLDILDQVVVDNSIESFQYYDYTPQSQQNLDVPGNAILMELNANDAYTIPSRSYLIIKGQLLRADNNNAYDPNDQVSLINNAMMYLFSEIKYSIATTDIERISSPGQTSSILGYLSLPDDYSTSAGLKSCWSKDTTNSANSSEFNASVAAPPVGYRPEKNPNYNQGFAARRSFLFSSDPRGSFSFVIPFSHMFGFAEYDKVIYGTKHTLSLIRESSDNMVIYHADGVQDGKVNLKNITWKIPHIKLETVNLMKMRGIISSKQSIPVGFRARNSESFPVNENLTEFSWRLSRSGGVEKPRWIIVGFQTNKSVNQTQNPALFDHINLSNAYVVLNGERYPQSDITTNFAANDYAELYERFDDFKKEYYGFNSLVGGTQVNFAAFKSLFPIIVFDVRRQNERVKTGVIDMDVHFKCRTGVPANTRGYAIVISERIYKFTSDGEKLITISR
jgi:hypothetical protein